MGNKKNINKAMTMTMVGLMSATSITTTQIKANETRNVQKDEKNTEKSGDERFTPKAGYTFLSAVKNVGQADNIVTIDYVNGEKTRITFLENNLFRLDMEPEGKDENFKDYADPNSKDHTGRIVQQKDDSNEYSKPNPTVKEEGDFVLITTDAVRLEINKKTSMMKLSDASGTTIWEESAPLQFKNGSTLQTLVENENENFYGGGTQNGRFAHKGKSIEIKNTNNWVDGGVASPNPFYWSTKGYGVVRNTFKPGVYDFGKTDAGEVVTSHDEKRFDAYYLVGSTPTSILNQYYKVTGDPALFPEASFYLGHLNCYNRDEWTPTSTGGNLLEDGNRYKETNNGGSILNGGTLETLNGTNNDDYKFSARAVIDGHNTNDMPLGWFLPNDGYGCGYGQSDTSLDDNVNNLKEFSKYANDRGITTGLWTQSALTPDPSQPIHLQRDFEKEVKNGGIRTLKTDVAWVGSGYSFGLNGITKAYNIISETNDRPTIVTLDGWAGTQRYGGIWTGDQTGGNWEYIRFHIPTYIGQSLSGNPNVSSDVDGIFGGSSLIQTRDIQWKSFTTMMLDMDGWGSYPKKPYIFGEDTTSINRMYLKLRAELMPYIYSTAYTSSNLGSGDEKGKPQVRAMFLEYPNDPNTYGTNVQYQYMFGKNLLVAPVYQDTAAKENGDDIRNGIYLPDENQTWIDYFTGKQYQGGKTLNNFDAPIWKLPLFVKNGAILPMYAENNNAAPVSDINKKGLDKTKRNIEFYPDASKKEGTDYTLYEDDGNAIDNTNKNQPTYGAHVTTNFTSKVTNGTAVLTAEKSVGSYAGYNANRDTTFVVNVSKEPTDISAKIGNTSLSKTDFKIVQSQEEFDKATGNVYFFNIKPDLNKFATEGSDFANKEIVTTPKLYVKFANTNVNENMIQLSVQGFINDGDLDKPQLNDELKAPADLKAIQDEITPTVIPLTWNKVDGATSYEIETDGIIQTGITETNYKHVDLEYNSKHTYRVRAVNKDGYSAWSEKYETQSALDPYRNVPKDIELKWDYGDSWGALKNALDFDYGTMFHSTNGDAVGKDFIMDMKKVYDMDKFEYTPRQDNKGNGTVQQMDVYASVDGKTYTLVHEGAKDEWTYANDDSRDTKTVDLSGVRARYLKLVVRKSKGGFFSAAEMQPYFKDGSVGILPGDTNNDGVVDDKDLVQINNYVGLEKGDATWDQVEKSDWNGNGYYDAQDIAYTTTLVNGGIKKAAGDPEGSIQFIPNKTSVKKGEKVIVSLYGINMKNVYATGFKIPYDNTLLKYDSAKPALSTVNMKQFAFDRVKVKSGEKADTTYTRNANLVFTNLGDETTINGTQSVGSVTFVAQQDMEINDDTFKDAEAMLVSSNLNAIDAREIPSEPTLPDASHVLTKDEIKSVQFSNDVKTDIPGADLWQQSNWMELLFDKNLSNLAEFKYYYGGADDIAEYVKVPTDISITLDSSRPVKSVKIYNRTGGNGTVTSIKAKAFAGTKEINLGTINEAKDEFEFKLPADSGSIDKIVVTPLTTTGSAPNLAVGGADNRMLSLREIEITENTETKVTGIELDKNNPTELYVGRVESFFAKVTPDDASNPYYDVISSDSDVVEVIKSSTGKGYNYALKGKKAGKAKITVTSKGEKIDGSKAVIETEVTVHGGLYTKDLETMVKTAEEKIKYEQLYTEVSLKAVVTEIEKAKEILNENKSQDDIDNQIININKALLALEYKGSNDNQPDSENEITNPDLKLVSASSEAAESPAANAIDGDEQTFWHSSYAQGATLPQDIVVDLGGMYNLQQVNYLARQDGSHNGDIVHYRIEVSSDGNAFTPVVEGTFDNDGNAILNRDEYKKVKFAKTEARYVKFIAINAMGDSPDTYASASEFKFFGRLAGESIPATGITLDKTEINDLQPGQKVSIHATLNPVDTTDELTWSSDNENVASVNSRGEITGISGGDATITVSANEHVKATVKVHVKDASKENLQALIHEAKAITYTNSNIQNALDNAIATAEAALNGSVDDMKNAYLVLAATISELDLIQKDVTAIESYTAIDLSLYEAGDAADNYKALAENAKELIKEPLANGKALPQMRSKLHDAYGKLVKLKLNQLEEALKIVKDVNLDDYIDSDAKTAFKALIKEAEGLKPTSNDEIKAMIDKLTEGLKSLELKANATQLKTMKELADKLAKLDITKYSNENQKKIRDGMEDVNKALANKNLSKKEAETLIAKLNALLTIEQEKPNNGGNTNDGNTNGGNPAETPDPDKKDPVIVNPSNPVDTSDTTQPIVWLSLIGLGGLGAYFAAKKKKHNKQS